MKVKFIKYITLQVWLLTEYKDDYKLIDELIDELFILQMKFLLYQLFFIRILKFLINTYYVYIN